MDDDRPAGEARCREGRAGEERAGEGRAAGPPAPVLAAVLVPVKAFSRAKGRLSPALSPAARAALARAMAERVVAAAGTLPVAVACDDPEVAAWAQDRGAVVVWTPGLGLNGAVSAGVAQLASLGARRVVVAHADLPLAAGLERVATSDGVVLVPDSRADGTPVASVPASCRFRFAYGPGSFVRHCGEASRLGLPLYVAPIPELRCDIDLPADLVVAPSATA